MIDGVSEDAVFGERFSRKNVVLLEVLISLLSPP